MKFIRPTDIFKTKINQFPFAPVLISTNINIETNAGNHVFRGTISSKFIMFQNNRFKRAVSLTCFAKDKTKNSARDFKENKKYKIGKNLLCKLNSNDKIVTNARTLLICFNKLIAWRKQTEVILCAC